ncbi:MAG: sigma-70 family RNA polymerase sigma factor [Planctomycetota bacterium]
MSDSGMGGNDEARNRADTNEAQQWRDLFEEARSGLRNFLSAKLPQDADVDDCLQTVFVAMLEHQPDVPVAARRAWLFRVASNEAALYWRKRKTTDRVLEKHGQYRVSSEGENTVTSYEIKETANHIQRAIDQFAPEVQVIVRMRVQENLTFQQIAHQLDIPLGTVLTRMRRAMERLRKQFRDEP